jgi:alkylated DNA repair protein (DNA oxidative demethylase)
MPDLFTDGLLETLDEGAVLLRGYATAQAEAIALKLRDIAALAPFRRMVTPGGKAMSVAMTSCGLGWVTDRRGYRYEAADPGTGIAWPAIPEGFLSLAKAAAARAGYAGFVPDACLINGYEPGARMALHQDRHERDFAAPIVSVSLGLPAVFLWGGKIRTERARRVLLESGDVVVWGGASRLNFHGVAPLKDGSDAAFWRRRINLTFRKAG